jgi:hypothetical protein
MNNMQIMKHRNRMIVTLLSLLATTVPVGAEENPPRVFDVHLHYSHNQLGVTSAEDAIDILRKQNVVYGVVSSTPPDLALELQKADPDRILPIWRPYLQPGARHNWFNDKRVLPAARTALASGKYYGIGELHMISGLGATPKNTILNGLISLGVEYDVPLLIHTETSSHKYFLPLCRNHPRARFLWAHAGSRLDSVEVGTLLKQCKNVWVEFSARDRWHYLDAQIVDGQHQLLPGWQTLIRRYPERFMIGADPVWPIEYLHSWDEPDTGWDRYNDFLNFHRRWLDKLPRKLANGIRYDNAHRFFFHKRKR